MDLRHIALLAACLAVAHAQRAVKVTVFYESLCPASVHFLTQQVYPTWRALGAKHMTVDLVPYGKATHQRDAYGLWWFRCQHGPAECAGNKLQACAIAALARSANRTLAVVNCIMSSGAPQDAWPQCSTRLPATVAEEIRECYATAAGDALLATLGDRTYATVPPIRLEPNTGHVPLVLFNGVYDANDEATAFDNLKAVVCKKQRGKRSGVCNRQLRTESQGQF